MSVFSSLKAKVTGITEEEQKMVDEFIAIIQKEHDHKLSLDGPEILAILKKHVPDSEDESEVEAAQQAAIDALLDADDTYSDEEEEDGVTDADRLADKAATKPRSAQKADADAVELASDIEGDATLKAELHEYVETESKRKRAPAQLGFLFHRTIGENKLLSYAEPGSRYDDKNEDGKDLYGPKGLYPNRKFDVRKPGKDGGGSFCQDVANSLTEGREYIRKLDLVSAALSEKEQTPPDYKGWRVTQLNEEKDFLKANLTALKNAVKAGLSVARKMYATKKQTKLIARFRTHGQGDKQTVVARHACIQVFYQRKEGIETVMVDRFISASTFLRVDLEVIGAMESAEDQLDAFVARKGTNDDDDKTETMIKIVNASDMADALYEIAGRKDDKALASSITKRIASDEGGEFLDSMYTAEEMLHSYTRRPENKAKVAEWRAMRDDAEKDKKPAKKEAA